MGSHCRVYFSDFRVTIALGQYIRPARRLQGWREDLFAILLARNIIEHLISSVHISREFFMRVLVFLNSDTPSRITVFEFFCFINYAK